MENMPRLQTLVESILPERLTKSIKALTNFVIMLNVHPTTFWAIGDLHLSFGKPRDLTTFGEAWRDHAERIAEDWRRKVQPQDVVLILGDISWATTVKRVMPDLKWLSELPGRKVLVRGNHDRWWVDVEKVRKQILPEGFYALQGNSMVLEGIVLCGAQGHIAPNDPYYHPDPPHNRYERELLTLQAALKSAEEVRQPGQPLIIMMHYPPFTSEGQPTAFSELIEQHAPAWCLYGHLHKQYEWEAAMLTEHGGVSYRLMASDFLGMQVQQIWPA
jgi:uncharacterized protein